MLPLSNDRPRNNNFGQGKSSEIFLAKFSSFVLYKIAYANWIEW